MTAAPAMLTRDFLFGLNILTLAGFLIMLLSMHLARTKQVRAVVAVVGMTVGTALVVFGLYAAHAPA
jgi:hypothetical protein